MNVKLLCRLLGILALLIGSVMLLSLIWAVPSIGFHTDAQVEHTALEVSGIRGLVAQFRHLLGGWWVANVGW